MNKEKSSLIVNALRDVIKNPKPELNYNNLYELTIAVILSAQTTDKRVNIVTKELFSKYPSFQELSQADPVIVANIIHSVGLYDTKAKHLVSLALEVINKYNGALPSDYSNLVKLPGIGNKTANVILAVGYNVPAFPVDTHVFRTSKRLGYIKDKDSITSAEFNLKKYIPKEDWVECHHLFLLFGRYFCKSQNPLCDNCKLKEFCTKKHQV